LQRIQQKQGLVLLPAYSKYRNVVFLRKTKGFAAGSGKSSYNLGANLEWQPLPGWCAMLGGSVGQARAGYVPWTDFSWHNWSLLGEFGFAPKDVLGLGPGVYRIEPFVAQVAGGAQTNNPIQGGPRRTRLPSAHSHG